MECNSFHFRIGKTLVNMIYIIHCNSCIYYWLSATQAFGRIPYDGSNGIKLYALSCPYLFFTNVNLLGTACILTQKARHSLEGQSRWHTVLPRITPQGSYFFEVVKKGGVIRGGYCNAWCMTPLVYNHRHGVYCIDWRLLSDC